MIIFKNIALISLLSTLSIIVPSDAQAFELEVERSATQLNFEWDSQPEMLYRLTSSQDLTTWGVVAEDLDGTAPMGTLSIPLPNTESRFYRMEEYLTPLVQVEMVTVGNPGNAPDPEVTSGFGAVNYEYKISKYEVTNLEYVGFLNAVDPLGSNGLQLFHREMTLNSINGGITLTPENFDGQKYEVKTGFEAKPVSYLSIFDAMRFCNWLHNGAQPNADTENGAYTLVGGIETPTNGETVQRNAAARFTVPTVDEWHKAAFYQPSNDGGDVDDYWLYPTRSNVLPVAEAPPGSAPAANYDLALTGFTNVGAYTNTVGYYGTYDMAGNASEWLETSKFNTTAERFLRLQRGSWWGNGRTTDLPSTSSSASFPGGLQSDGLRISGH